MILSKSVRMSAPSLLLHAEGLMVFIAAIVLYAQQGASAWMFLLLLLAPDVSALGYVANPRLGSLTYNAVHTYLAPALLVAFSLPTGFTFGVHVAIIWVAHIGMDRAFGFGLKYATRFKDTHFDHL